MCKISLILFFFVVVFDGMRKRKTEKKTEEEEEEMLCCNVGSLEGVGERIYGGRVFGGYRTRDSWQMADVEFYFIFINFGLREVRS